MGCDIHLHTEIKFKGKWHSYSKPKVKRSYGLFSKMANVRNGGLVEPISRPKGLPEDVTELTKYCSDHTGTDGHSHSWLSSGEVSDLCLWIKEEGFTPSEFFQYLFGNGWGEFYNYKEGYPKDLEDFRFVFWFDN